MVQIFPFRGLRYNPAKIANLGAVTAPPYDVIDAAQQQALLNRHPANVVRLILNPATPGDTETDSPYTRAAGFLRQWQADGTFAQDDQPTVYAYSQQWDGITRRGCIALLRLEDYATGQVMPHEFTLRGPKQDRMQLMQHTLCNLSQIFMIYDDPSMLLEKRLFEEAPANADWQEVYDDDQVLHRLRPVSDAGVLGELQALFANQKLLIADGHHRYETALAFRDEARAKLRETSGQEPAPGALLSDYMMIFLTNLNDPGLVVYPTDRVLLSWPQGWDQARFEAELLQRYDVVDSGEDFTYQTPDRASALKLKLKPAYLPKDLPAELQSFDAALLEETVFKGIFATTGEALKADHTLGFYRNPEEVQRLLAEREAVAVFYMGTPSVSHVRQICEAGHRMPQKSTYFYPKLLSGLVFYIYNSDALAGVLPGAHPLPDGLFARPTAQSPA